MAHQLRSLCYVSQAEEYLLSLDPVLQRLGNDIPQAGYDRRSLAQLVVQLQQFMEVALGIKVGFSNISCICRFNPTVKSLRSLHACIQGDRVSLVMKMMPYKFLGMY